MHVHFLWATEEILFMHGDSLLQNSQKPKCMHKSLTENEVFYPSHVPHFYVRFLQYYQKMYQKKILFSIYSREIPFLPVR